MQFLKSQKFTVIIVYFGVDLPSFGILLCIFLYYIRENEKRNIYKGIGKYTLFYAKISKKAKKVKEISKILRETKIALKFKTRH